MSIQAYEQTFKAIDTTFNVFGYIPIVSSFSGPIRTYYGVIQAVAAIAIAILGSTGLIAITSATMLPMIVSHLLISGIFHVIRGYIEQVPFVGNATCFIYDLARVLYKI
jgi:hypothetical protein